MDTEKVLPWAVGLGGLALGVGLYLALRPKNGSALALNDPNRYQSEKGAGRLKLPTFLDTHEELKLGRDIDWDRLRKIERDRRIAKEMGRRGYVWNEDPAKFADSLEYGVITLRNGVEGRIQSMYAQVDAFDGPASPMVRPLIESSEKAFYNAATDLYQKLSDKSKWPALATQLGVPVSTITSAEATLVALFKKVGGVDISKVLESLHGAVGDLVLAFVRKVTAQLATELSSTLKSFSEIGDFSEAVPLIGTFVKAAIQMYVSYQTSVNEEWTGFARSFTAGVYQQEVMPLVERYMPLLWNAEVAWDLTPPKPPGGLKAPKYMETPHREQWAKVLRGWRQAVLPAMTDIEKTLQKKGTFSYGLPIEAAALVRKWWAGAAGVIGDGRIAQVFSAMERDRQTIMTANDEMLLPVTSVISLLEGEEPVDFAKLVWGFAAGWRDEATRAGDEFVGASIDLWGYAPAMKRKAYNMSSMVRTAYELVDVLDMPEIRAVSGPKVRNFAKLNIPVVAPGLEGVSSAIEAARAFRTTSGFAHARARTRAHAEQVRMNGQGGEQMTSGRSR